MLVAIKRGVCRSWWIRFVPIGLAITLCFCLLSSCCLIFQKVETDRPPTNPLQIDQLAADVAQMTALLGMAGPLPQHLQQADAQKNGSEFDVNRFFAALEHLSMQSGYTLDYVYRFDGMGGSPVPYARPLNQAPYGSYADLEAVWQSENPNASKEQYDRYLEFVQLDGTPESFFQLVVLRTMSRQFYQYWHSGYNDAQILVNLQSLDQIQPMFPEEKLTAGLMEKARSLPIEPQIQFQGDLVTMQVMIFTHWGGFMQETYTIAGTFPHRILNQTRETLLEYNCGVSF
jgi:hypothetical protein